MAADIATTLPSWSTTAASNAPSGSTAISTNLDDNLRQIQAVVRTLAASSTIASATTTDLSTINEAFISVSGTTTITALGTLSAGMYKWLIFEGALTFTHNATSLILPTGANITTAAGDVTMMLSLGSGNWRCMGYLRKNGQPVGSSALLSGIGAAIAANTIANTDYAQEWQWKLTTASKSALKLTETTASTGGSGSQYLLDVGTLAASTANPLRVAVRGEDAILVDRAGDVTITAHGSGKNVTITGATVSTMPGGQIRLRGSATGSGDVLIDGGSPTSSAAPGKVAISAGEASFTGSAVAGADITLSAGGAGGTTGNAAGGNISIAAGSGIGSGDHGSILFTSDPGAMGRFEGNSGHLMWQVGNGTPTIASGGGTGPSIAGRDQAFVVTAGTGSPTGEVLINYGGTWSTAPVVCVSTSQASLTFRVSTVSTTQVGVTPSAAITAGTTIHIISAGYI